MFPRVLVSVNNKAAASAVASEESTMQETSFVSRLFTFRFALLSASISSLLTVLLSLAFTGCGTVTFDQVVTPARVQAVVTWGTYLTAKEVLPGEAENLERAKAGLLTLRASGNVSVESVAAALTSAGITWIDTPEGGLAVTAVLTFSDLWADVTTELNQSKYVTAVLDGAISGLDLALSTKRTIGELNVRDELSAKAIAHRVGPDNRRRRD